MTRCAWYRDPEVIAKELCEAEERVAKLRTELSNCADLKEGFTLVRAGDHLVTLFRERIGSRARIHINWGWLRER